MPREDRCLHRIGRGLKWLTIIAVGAYLVALAVFTATWIL